MEAMAREIKTRPQIPIHHVMQVLADSAYMLHGSAPHEARGLRDAAVSGYPRGVFADRWKVPNEPTISVGKNPIAIDDVHVGMLTEYCFHRRECVWE
jgi:hypothetical protein